MTGLGHDVWQAARLLRRTPGFTALSAAVLALGIGANTAIFSLLDAALLRPLPFDRPETLVMISERSPRSLRTRVSPLNFLDWSERQQTFASMAAIAGGSRTLTGAGAMPERIPGQAVTFRFFDVLGATPVAGRLFNADDAAARANVVVLSERFWKSRFGRDPALVGGALTLDGESFTVIGVAPEHFQFLSRADFWTIFGPRRSPEQRRQHYLQVVGRLKDGVAIEQAAADMANVAAQIAAASPETNHGWAVTIDPLGQAVVGLDLRTTSVVLAAVVAFVLLMACANVANLLLARAIGRAREIAVRAALGASRARIVRQLLVETAALSMVGGAAGLALAWAAIRSAPHLLPPDTLPQGIVLTFDRRVAAAAVLATLATSVLCGLLPAWQASNTPASQLLAGGGRGATVRARRMHAALVVAEVSASVLLLSGAGLLLRTLIALDRVDPGFRADRVLTSSLILPFNRYAGVERMLRFYADAERELSAIPGVTAAAFGGSLPLDGFNIGQGYEIVGDPPLDRANMLLAHYQIVSSRYFRVLGIDLLRGRGFTDFDTTQSTPICIVNEEFVRRHMSSRDPVGALVSVQSMDLRSGPTPVVRQIVGVVRQVATEAAEKERAVEIYVPITQNPWFSAAAIVRTSGDPLGAMQPMKAAIARVDKDQALTRFRTMDEVAAQATAQPRFRARIVAAFAAIALALASVGIFGVLAYSVNQRAREFGIRMALGARASDVLWLVLRGALGMTAGGVVVGLAASAALTRFLGSLLYAVGPLDPVTFASTAVILVVAALAASAAPASKAVNSDFAVNLKSDV